MGLSTEWTDRLPALPDWMQMIVLGAFVLAGIGYVKPTQAPLREGINRVFSLTDTISMGFVLMSSVGLLLAPVIWTVVQPRWISLPALAVLALVGLNVRFMRPIGGLSRAENAVLICLPALVYVDIVLGMPVALRSTALLMTIASGLSVFVAFTADADDRRSRFYHHRNFVIVIHLARWGLRAIPIYAIYHLVVLSREWVDSATRVLTIVAVGLVVLAVVCLALALFNWKGLRFSSKER